jgi:hypothetical protein
MAKCRGLGRKKGYAVLASEYLAHIFVVTIDDLAERTVSH